VELPKENKEIVTRLGIQQTKRELFTKEEEINQDLQQGANQSSQEAL